jgi:PTH1 family peptidyl-tRNA hydrolase
MKLLVGLGNPGEKYNSTRHNIGFAILDELTKIFGVDFCVNKKFHSETAEIIINKQKIILLKPLTYMNESGLAVLEAKKFFKISLKDILIIHDDKDIALGEHKLQFNRSSAGHNGVQSIIDRLGTKSFFRFRFGIKPKTEIKDTADFVLKKFTAQEKKIINEKIIKAVENISININKA